MLTTTTVLLAFTFLAWEKRRTFRSSSIYTGICYLLCLVTSFLSFFLFASGGYIEGSVSGLNGKDLVREAGGGVVAVFIQYRLGVFGFLAGEKVKEGGALNAGLCEYL